MISLASIAICHGQAYFESSFTAGEGYQDGRLENQPDARAQEGIEIRNSAGKGEVHAHTSGFKRFGLGQDAGLKKTDIKSFPEGAQIRTILKGLTISGQPSNDQSNILSLGLMDSHSNIGETKLSNGGQLVANLDGSILLAPKGYNADGVLDSGVKLGDTFDYEVRFTAESGGTFQIDQLINGRTVLSRSVESVDFEMNGANAALFVQGLPADGDSYTYSFDGASLIVERPSVAVSGGPLEPKVYFESSFTADEGYENGRLNGWDGDTAAQNVFEVANVYGTGRVLSNTSGYQRAFMGVSSGLTKKGIENLAPGSSVSVKLEKLNITGIPTRDNSTILNLGIADVSSMKTQSGAVFAGGGLLLADLDNTLRLSYRGRPSDQASDSSVRLGETFDYEIIFWSEGGGTFQVDQLINGRKEASQKGVELTFAGEDERSGLFVQGNTTTGDIYDFQFDGAKLEVRGPGKVARIPEPRTYALIAGILTFAYIAYSRRRK
ncbi:MAG: hypothetical protein AAFX93_16320 [Verrucomicrobiota bacterium]